MDSDILQSIDLRQLGQRLQEARKTGGLTQEQVAGHLGVARTTLTAIEKGERRLQPAELIQMAALYGRRVGEFLRQGEPVAFAVQLRASLAPGEPAETELASYIQEFDRLCEDYLELEKICDAPLPRKYPPPYTVGRTAPEVAAEDVAGAERNRLGVGDGPILNLREILENDVGLRIFTIDLPSRVAAMFGYTEELGGCIAVNRKHPEERRRMSTCHDYGHFLENRFRPEVVFLGRYQRQPEHERFAEAFARAFLMPASGLSRRYNEIYRSREGRVTPADLCTLAHFYFVSVEALTRRLEELRLLPSGTWDRLEQAGFRVREAQALLQLSQHPATDQMLPTRYLYLAAEAFERGDLSEGQFSRFLRVDRTEARRLAVELGQRTVLSDEGAISVLPFDLSGNVTE
ncbi:MAG: ImmA/IrrE family metallo-endopeptidase [Chloroflexi bacterium]|nr:ImmA/IrrE family metallo-endopeptidase [Chloroflexota bacterium]